MATLLSGPDDFNPLRGGGLRWCFQGSGTDGQSTGYQIFFDGAAITEIEEIGQGSFCLRPGTEFEKLFLPLIPSLTATSPFADTEAVKDAKVDYGDITYDEENCESTANIGSSTPTIKVVNAVIQDWETNLFAGPIGKGLSSRPKTTNIYSNQYNFISVFNEAAGEATIVKHYIDGSQAITVAATASGITVIPCGPANMVGGGADGLSWYEIQGVGPTWCLKVCQTRETNMVQILFFEPIGGWSVINGRFIDSSGAGGTSERYFTMPPDAPTVAQKLQYGSREVNLTGQIQVSIQLETQPDPEWGTFVAALAASKYKFLIRNTGVPELMKFNTSGSGGLTQRGRLNRQAVISGYVEIKN